MTKIIAFCGSSSVGKTTTLTQLNKAYFEPVYISARDVRARLNNPTWDDLMTKSDIAHHHQDYILKSYMDSINLEIYKHNERHDGSVGCRVMVFERSLWDVIGYSFAYKCEEQFIEEQISEVQEFEEKLRETVEFTQIVRFPISNNYIYDSIPERPPESVRDMTDEWLDKNWRRSIFAECGLSTKEYPTVSALQQKLLDVAGMKVHA